MGQKNATDLPLSEHPSTQGCPLWANKTPLLCKRKVDHYPVAFGVLGLFLIFVLRDLSVNLGEEKPSSHSTVVSSLLWKPAVLKVFVISLPSLP